MKFEYKDMTFSVPEKGQGTWGFLITGSCRGIPGYKRYFLSDEEIDSVDGRGSFHLSVYDRAEIVKRAIDRFKDGRPAR